MSFLLKKNIHTSLAEIFYNDILSRRSNYYFYIGKTVEWDDPNNPDIPVETGDYEYDTRNGLISIKKVLPQDISFVIPRRNWESGVVYDQYDPNYSPDFPAYSGAESLKDSTFYVLSAYQGIHYNVYKCLSNNNNSLSTDKPTGSDFVPLTYPDGYVWKYMFTIPLNLRNKFLTNTYIPVIKAVNSQYYSNGEISNIIVDHKGNGYSSNAMTTLECNCEFFGLSGNVSANIRPVLNEVGQFVDVLVTDKGNNIKSANITINDLSESGLSFYKQANSIVLSYHGSGYTNDVIANTTVSISTIGDQPTSNAIGVLTFGNTSVVSATLLNGGSGYTKEIADNTSISIYTSGNSQPITQATADIRFNTTAVLKPLILNGKLEDVIIEDPGIGYSSNIQTTLSLIGDGEGAKLTPHINEQGQLEDVIIENRGNGYTYLDITVIGDGNGANAYSDFYVGDLNTQQSTVELSAVKGAIHNIRVIDGGDSFSTATISILGDGSGFVGNVVIENNIISKINVINPGINYTYANVIISGDGANAICTAIMSPNGGHGFDPIKELYADTLIIYSNVNNEKNQGIFVNNDYRQYGLIRNPRVFGDGDLFEDTLGSSCYLANLINKTGLVSDDKLVLEDDETVSFNVISVDSNSNKVLLSSINNHKIVNTDVLLKPSTSELFNIYDITALPTVDKFSGDMIYIDNRTTITISNNQLVALKTIIRF